MDGSAGGALQRGEKQFRIKIFRKMFLMALGLLVLVLALCFWVTQPLLVTGRIVPLDDSVSPERLKNHVRALSEKFHPRSHSYTANLDRAAEYIKQEFITAGGRVSEQAFQIKGKTYRNIVASFGPENKEKIIVGAHYDSAFQTPGADDNASGVAGLIELAFLLGRRANSAAAQTELVAYTLEEPPYFATEQMGSFLHAKSSKEQNSSIRLMISLEMIGYFSDAPGSQQFPVSIMNLFYPSKGNFIAVVGNFTNGLTVRNFKKSMTRGTDLPVYSTNAPTFISGVDFSDHRNYWKFVYKALMVTDTAFYRNSSYHTESDTAEKLDYVRMAEVVKATFYAVSELAE
jgi:Zn-dependent M28 family amino/carboxypeptidase